MTLDDLAEVPRLTFDQGANNSFYFAEEILSTLSSPQEIRVSDRATIFNLMIGLDGYTISTGIISDDLDPEIVAIPLDVDERIEIGWIGHSAIPLTEQAQRLPRRTAHRRLGIRGRTARLSAALAMRLSERGARLSSRTTP